MFGGEPMSMRTILLCLAAVFFLGGAALAQQPKILILGLDRNLEDSGDNVYSSAPVIQTLLAGLGYTDVTLVRVAMSDHTTLASFDYTPYTLVFVCNAMIVFSPYNHVFNTAEGQQLVNYLNLGGRVYMEGGDVWYQDPAFNSAYNFRSAFGVASTTQASDSLYTVKGKASTFLSGLQFSYNTSYDGFRDVITGSGGGLTVMENYSNAGTPVVTGAVVAYKPLWYRTIASDFRFAGLTDGSGSNTRSNLLQQYVNYLMAPIPARPYDFNGDGYTDILWRHSTNGTLGNWYVTRTGATAGALYGVVSDANWQVNGCGDFSRDGYADLVWRQVSSGDLVVWQMDAGGYDSSVSLGTVNPTWKVLGAADFNRNGNADLLWRNFSDGFLSVWLMSTSIAYQDSTFAGGISDLNWKALGTGHFDSDGRADVLWWNATSGTLSIWFEDESGFLGDMSPGTVSTTWKVTGIGDADGNGIDDILWRNSSNGDLSVWFLNDGGTVSGTTFLGGISDLNWKVKGVGDFNKDGRADILWRHATSGAVVVWYLSGTGVSGSLYLGSVDPVWEVVNQANFPGASELP